MLHIIRNKDNTFDMVRFSGNAFNQISRSQQGYKRRREIYKVIATELRNDFEVYPFSNLRSVARIVQDDTAAKPTVMLAFDKFTLRGIYSAITSLFQRCYSQQSCSSYARNKASLCFYPLPLG